MQQRNDTLHSGIDACHFLGKDERTLKVNQWHCDTWITNHCGLAPDYVNVLDDPLNEGAIDGIAENYFISGSSIGIVHTQVTKLNLEVTQGDYKTLMTC